MDTNIISSIVEYGVFLVLFIWLFQYTLKKTDAREVKLYETIGKLTMIIEKELQEIKEKLPNE